MADMQVSSDPSADSSDLWKNRRRMGYIALLSMIAVTAYAMSPWIELDKLKALESVITWFYTAMASIIASYMGFTTWAYIKK
jgi:hypothetical protein